MDREKDGACKIDRPNEKCSCARKCGRRKNNAGTDKEEKKKLTPHFQKRNYLLKDALEQVSSELRKTGYWVSRATSRTLQVLERERGNYVVAYSR